MTDIVQKMRDDADQLYACDSNWWLMDTINYLRDGADEIERLREALAAEREACAQVAKEYAENRTHGWPGLDQDEVCHAVSRDIAAAIRAGSQGAGG